MASSKLKVVTFQHPEVWKTIKSNGFYENDGNHFHKISPRVCTEKVTPLPLLMASLSFI